MVSPAAYSVTHKKTAMTYFYAQNNVILTQIIFTTEMYVLCLENCFIDLWQKAGASAMEECSYFEIATSSIPSLQCNNNTFEGY